MIRVLFFAKLRERLDCGGLEWPLEAPCSVRELRQQLVTKNPGWENDLCGPNVITACNQEVVQLEAQVAPGDELAFYPPVTGG